MSTQKTKLKNKSSQLPLAPILRLMKEATGMLVSEKAALLMRDLLEETIERLAESAADIAKIANKKTITDEMLKVAKKNRERGR